MSDDPKQILAETMREEYERLLSERFAHDPDTEPAEEREARERRIFQLYMRLYGDPNRPYADEWRNTDEMRLRIPPLDPLVPPGE